MQKLMREKGFALTEILVVVVIAAIIVALAAIAYMSIQRQAHQAAAMEEFDANAQNISSYALSHRGRMPTFEQTQTNTGMTIKLRQDVYKVATYCSGGVQAAFGALLKSGDVVYMQIGSAPMVDNTFSPEAICDKLGIVNNDGSAAEVNYIIEP